MTRPKLRWIIPLLLTLLVSLHISAQPTPIVTIAVPSFWEMIFDEAVLADFEAQYGVDVQLVYDAPTPALPASLDNDSIMSWQESLLEYAQSADVLFVDESILMPEVSRAGIVQDLNPLLQADSTINSSDFYPTIWDSFSWDGGQWAIPIAGSTTLVEYIPTAFDAKGLIYPDANWSIAEFASTARALAEFDDAGNVTLPGMLIGLEERTLLFYSLLEYGFSDDQQPDMPQFSSEDLALLFDTWQELLSEGVIASDPSAYFNRRNDIPLKIGSGGFFTVIIEDDGGNESESIETGGFGLGEPTTPTALAPLLNHIGGVSAQGFAISNGTPNPQLAYDLVRYLSERPEIAGLAFGAKPARPFYATQAIDSQDNGITISAVGGENRSEADDALIQQALQSGITSADLRFGHYLTHVDGVIQSGLDSFSALQSVEGDANRAVSTMMDADLTIIVNTPEQIIIPEGEILLNFGLTSFVQPLPNSDIWDTLARDFAQADPEVGYVEINSGFMRSDQMLRINDCVYQPTTTGIFDLNTAQLLAIDPLLSADPNYNINDLPPNILGQMQFNGTTYGLPITLQPEVLTYMSRAFEDAGIIPPTDGWSFGEFENALMLLDDILDDEDYPLEAISPINTHLLMLIAAQGGRLFNTSTTPVTIDFTSHESINAVMQILDLAKDDLIKYERLGESGGFDFVAIAGEAFPNIQASNFFGFLEEGMRLAPYPDGTQYTPVSLSVGAGFIGIDSAHPEACYRWLSYLANHPFAFTDMPALLSTLDDPSAEASMGTELVTTYRQIADQATRPNAINPIVWDPFIMLWLDRAFDAYVLDDGDLDAELMEAEQSTQAYIDCISQPLDGDTSQDSIFEQLESCGQQLDIN